MTASSSRAISRRGSFTAGKRRTTLPGLPVFPIPKPTNPNELNGTTPVVSSSLKVSQTIENEEDKKVTIVVPETPSIQVSVTENSEPIQSQSFEKLKPPTVQFNLPTRISVNIPSFEDISNELIANFINETDSSTISQPSDGPSVSQQVEKKEEKVRRVTSSNSKNFLQSYLLTVTQGKKLKLEKRMAVSFSINVLINLFIDYYFNV